MALQYFREWGKMELLPKIYLNIKPTINETI